MHTIVTPTDSVPQSLNQALSSSFVHATQIGTPSSVQFHKLGLITEVRPLRVFDFLRGGTAIHAHLQQLRKIIRSGWPRSLRWFPPGRRNRLSRPPRHSCATQSTRIRTQPNQRAGQRKPHRIAHLRNQKSTLAGTTARYDEFYRGVLRNGGGLCSVTPYFGW